MEGAVANTLSAGDTALVVDGGKFGERWTELCTFTGSRWIASRWSGAGPWTPKQWPRSWMPIRTSRRSWSRPMKPPPAVHHPVKELAAVTKTRPGTILMVDAISALGGYALPMDEWGIDVLVAGSQKAMMLPPGLAFAALSPKAWELVKASNLPKYYFDFAKQLKSQGKNQTPVYLAGVPDLGP